jgi:Pyruvate phosphate dikinase, AMP/ATP-binding domain
MPRPHDFQSLMRHRVDDVLLVASPYDAFILEEDVPLEELFLRESFDRPPRLTAAASADEALALLADGPFQLVVTSIRVGGTNAVELARRMREAGHAVPVVILAYDGRDLADFEARHEAAIAASIERTFLWQGDARLLPAIVRLVEDRRNVDHDAREAGVQVILLIEDSPRSYSSFLPVIYHEVLHHSQRLLAEGMNLAHRLMRLRARPRILLCRTFEEAWAAVSAYQEEILGVVSDVGFPRGGHWSRRAGVDFARTVRNLIPDVPLLLQSSHAEYEELARAVGASFLVKGSPVLLQELRRFMTEYFGFGDFVFRLPDGTEVGRARDMKDLVALLPAVPVASIAYHAERNHFSKWLKARTEFTLASHLRPEKVTDFSSHEELRQSLIDAIAEYRLEQNRGAVADFDRRAFEASGGFYRVGGGSLGGKARGLAFARKVVLEEGLGARFQGVEVVVPPAVVLGTDVFDRFLAENDLSAFALECEDDAALTRRFQAARFPEEALSDLRAFAERTAEPLAVRSSSLLEDSQYQPFAGVYETVMLPNVAPDAGSRLERILGAIKRVYASTFSEAAKRYLAATPFRLEEEKMAVLLQRVVGAVHGPRFYPHFAGVARSHDFYPVPPLTASDGVAAVALGLGKTVVEGGRCVRFSPRDPRRADSSGQELLETSQRAFWALPIHGRGSEAADFREALFDLGVAEADGTLAPVASTYSAENDLVSDGLSRPGIRLVSFALILKHGLFPLAEVLEVLLKAAVRGIGAPVEIEFAVSLPSPPARLATFGFLQMRPLALSRELEELELGTIEAERLLVRSANVMGNGKLEGIRDLVVVDVHRFERGRSREAAHEVARLNAELTREGVPYVLVGVGRWGSRDEWLGIPVTWDQIAGARAIVEAGLRDLKVTPSQGSHFFQNLTSFNVGYFTVNADTGDGFVDWDWLNAQAALSEAAHVRHLRLPAPLLVKMNGKRNEGVIYKPASV